MLATGLPGACRALAGRSAGALRVLGGLSQACQVLAGRLPGARRGRLEGWWVPALQQGLEEVGQRAHFFKKRSQKRSCVASSACKCRQSHPPTRSSLTQSGASCEWNLQNPTLAAHEGGTLQPCSHVMAVLLGSCPDGPLCCSDVHVSCCAFLAPAPPPTPRPSPIVFPLFPLVASLPPPDPEYPPPRDILSPHSPLLP